MRMVFSVLGLLISLAVVGWLIKSQMRALAPVAPPSAVTGAATSAAANTGATPPANQVQQVREDLNKALAEGAARTASAAEQ